MTNTVPDAAPGDKAISEDTLLGGRIRLRQKVSGYRAAIDPVLLAAAVPAAGGEQVLDVGSGAGAAAFCLAARVPGARVTGIEKQLDLVRLAAENAALNGMEGRLVFVRGDILDPPPRLAPGGYDHVMVNPPFRHAGAGTVSPDLGKAAANVEGEADLEAFVRFALAMARQKGSLTFIHRADRLETLLARLAGKAGELVVFPLWPGAGKAAKRVIVRARKGIATPTRLSPGLVLHEADGRFTAAADRVLRDGDGLDLQQ